MKALILAIAMVLGLLPAPAGADQIARHGPNWVRVMDAACNLEGVRAMILMAGENPDQFRLAVGGFGGRQFNGCYKIYKEQEMVGIFWEDGDRGAIGVDELRDVPGA